MDSTQNKITLSTPVQFLKGVGPARAKVFAQHNVETVADLLEYFPRDWNFISPSVKINEIIPDRRFGICVWRYSAD